MNGLRRNDVKSGVYRRYYKNIPYSASKISINSLTFAARSEKTDKQFFLH